MTASTSAKKSAVQNPVTTNPGTMADASITRSALMTSEKKPKVMSVMGNVRISKMGRINRFNAASTTAAIMAPESVTLIPGTIYAAIRIATVAISQ